MTSSDMDFGFAAAPPGRFWRQIFVRVPPLAAVSCAFLGQDSIRLLIKLPDYLHDSQNSLDSELEAG